MTFDKLVYIRTDRNGTKIYHDWTCPRCGGAGESDKWIMTGKICFECGGTGKRRKAKVVKEYTEEHAAELEARRKARDEARKAAEQHDPEMERKNREAMAHSYAQYGCGNDGVGYVLNGNTYPIKERIKKAGGKWLCGRWICPINVKCDGVKAYRIDVSGSLGCNGWISGKPDLIDLIVECGAV